MGLLELNINSLRNHWGTRGIFSDDLSIEERVQTGERHETKFEEVIFRRSYTLPMLIG